MKISKEHMAKDEAAFLAFNVVQILMKKIATAEMSGIAVLMLMETFAKEDIF